MVNSIFPEAEKQSFSVHSTEEILTWLESRKNNLSVWLDNARRGIMTKNRA